MKMMTPQNKEGLRVRKRYRMYPHRGSPSWPTPRSTETETPSTVNHLQEILPMLTYGLTCSLFDIRSISHIVGPYEKKRGKHQVVA